MSTKSVTPNPQAGHPDDWDGASSTAPSVLRRDDPSVARVLGSVGASAVIFGGAVLMMNLGGKATPVSSGWASLFLALGMCCLLIHATFDWDTQFRRLYMVFAYLLQVAGAFLMVLPYPNQSGDLFGPGLLLVTLGLFFLLGFLRNEDDPWLRNLAQWVLGGFGAVMAVVGLFGGNLTVAFMVPYGLMLSIVGLVYLIAFITSRGIGDDTAYNAGLGLGAAGALVFFVAFGRTVFAADSIAFLVPSGALLMLLGFLYVAAALCLCSDWTLAVLTRRELGSFFYSPMAYFVLFACVLAYGWSYFEQVARLTSARGAIFEPIVRGFIWQLMPVLFVMCAVPVLTMRVLAEERRSGTLEVLLTSPVTETAVVLSKFLAAMAVFLLTWLPLGWYLVFLRMDTGRPFDYRPLLSFFMMLAFTGAAFVSMGVFFSSITRNQIVSGVLTLVGMVGATGVLMAQGLVSEDVTGTNPWTTVLKHVSYLDAWYETLGGALQPTYMIFFGSLTVLWLFLAVKALEARKWAG
jgi:ABC-type transport system involved in multi-copper enzyme maturation permease subunit